MLELHCPVTIVNVSGRNNVSVLFLKRSQEREFLPGLWEFGAAKPNSKEPMIETLKREYKEDTGLDINLLMDASSEKFLCPIYTYEILKGDNLCKGIGFAAYTELSEEDKFKVKLTDKHDAYKWVKWTKENGFIIPHNEDSSRAPFKGMEFVSDDIIDRASQIAGLVNYRYFQCIH